MKRALFFLLLLLLTPAVIALQISQPNNGAASNQGIRNGINQSGGSGTDQWFGQTVLINGSLNSNVTVKNLTLRLASVAGAGTCAVGIRTINSNTSNITQADIGSNVTINAADFGAAKDYTFNWTSNYPSIQANISHAFVLSCTSSNTVTIYGTNTDDYAPGTCVFKGDSESVQRSHCLAVSPARDLAFTLYYDLIVPEPDNITFAQTYSANVMETASNPFILNATYNASVSQVNATFIYNGTVYNATRSNWTNSTRFNLSLSTPLTANGTVVNFTWNVSVGYYDGNVQLLNQTGNHTIHQMIVSNCTTSQGTTRTMQLNISDEETGDLINASTISNLTVWNSSQTLNRTHSVSWTGNNTPQLCIYPAFATLTTNADLFYSNTSYPQRKYSLSNATLTNTSQNLALFLLRDTSANLVTITVTDENDDAVVGAFVHVLAFDIGTGTYQTVEVLETDFLGRAFAQLILEDQWYKFNVVYNGATVLSTSATRILTTTVNLQVNLGTDYFDSYTVADSVNCNIGFNNATKNFSMNFTNPTGESITGRLLVHKVSAFSDSVFNQSNVSGASGSILVGIDALNGTTYTGVGTIFIGDNEFACGTPNSQVFGGLWESTSLQGVFYSFLLLVFLVAVSLWSPVAGVVLSTVALVFSVLLGILYISWVTLITLVIIGGVIIFKIKR